MKATQTLQRSGPVCACENSVMTASNPAQSLYSKRWVLMSLFSRALKLNKQVSQRGE